MIGSALLRVTINTHTFVLPIIDTKYDLESLVVMEIYSEASLIQTLLIQIIQLYGHMFWNQLRSYIVIHLSGYSVIQTVSLGMEVSG